MSIPYPSSLPKPSYDGYANSPDQTYFITNFDYGTKSRPRNTGLYQVDVTFNLNNSQMEAFNGWYYGKDDISLNGGVKTFTATWILAGVETQLEYKFRKDGQPKISPSGVNHWTVSCGLVLISDIFEVLANNNLNGWCPDITDCQESIINLGL